MLLVMISVEFTSATSIKTHLKRLKSLMLEGQDIEIIGLMKQVIQNGGNWFKESTTILKLSTLKEQAMTMYL